MGGSRSDSGGKWVHFIYTLLKLANNYYLSVLSMSVIGLQKKGLDGGGGVGEVSSIQFC